MKYSLPHAYAVFCGRFYITVHLEYKYEQKQCKLASVCLQRFSSTDVPRPLTNDLWVFLSQRINTEYVKLASPAGTYVYVKAFIANVNKRLKPFFL